MDDILPKTMLAKMIYCNEESLDYPKDVTLTELLLNYNLNGTPADKPSIIDGISGEVIFTYRSFRESVRKIAHHLRDEIGLVHGDVVGILSTNRSYYPVCVHGILATGAVVSALNPIYESNELLHAINLSEPRYILVERDLLPKLAAAIRMFPSSTKKPSVYIWDSDKAEPEVAQVLNVEKVIRDGSSNFELPKLALGSAAKQLAFICFSSGTSGTVKGVRLSHGNIVANIFQQSQGLRGMFNESTVLALVVPFFHILGLAGFSCQYVCQGAPIVVFRRFELGPLIEAIKRQKITHINVVPPIALELLKNPLAAKGDYSSVKCLINAAAPLNQRQADELSKKFDCAVTSWYGMTEASPSVASQREDEMEVPGTIGKLLPGIEMRVVDEDGNDAHTGEFIIRGPNIMQGYVGSVEQTESSMTSDGFMKTGDIGYVNDHGYLFIVDRAKEMIKVKGHQVAPAELEAILITHPLVTDAAVCGIYNDDGSSEIPLAYITTNIQDLTEREKLKADVTSFVNCRVAKYKYLTGGISILSVIPRNPAGKILRRVLPAKLRQGAHHPLAKNKGLMRETKL